MIKFSKIFAIAALVCFCAGNAVAAISIPDFNNNDEYTKAPDTPGGGINTGNGQAEFKTLCQLGETTTSCSGGKIITNARAVKDDNGGLHTCYTCQTPNPCDYGAVAYKDSNNNIVKCGCN